MTEIPNNYYLRIAGKVNVPELIPIGHNYLITVNASVTQEQKIDNNDGTFDIVSKAEPITVQIQKDNGPIIKARDKAKMSQRLRGRLHGIWSGLNIPMDSEAWYEDKMRKIILHADEVLDFIEKLEK